MKITEELEDPSNPNSDVILSFDFDDTPEDQELLKILTASASAQGISVGELLIKIIEQGAADQLVTPPKKTTKKKARKK